MYWLSVQLINESLSRIEISWLSFLSAPYFVFLTKYLTFSKDKFYKNQHPLSTILSSNDIEVNHKRFESAGNLNKNREMSNDLNSFSDGQFDRRKAFKNMEQESGNNTKNTSSSSSASVSASSISPIGATMHTTLHGHRQCSSYDTSLIDTSESYENDVSLNNNFL